MLATAGPASAQPIRVVIGYLSIADHLLEADSAVLTKSAEKACDNGS